MPRTHFRGSPLLDHDHPRVTAITERLQAAREQGLSLKAIHTRAQVSSSDLHRIKAGRPGRISEAALTRLDEAIDHYLSSDAPRAPYAPRTATPPTPETIRLRAHLYRYLRSLGFSGDSIPGTQHKEVSV